MQSYFENGSPVANAELWDYFKRSVENLTAKDSFLITEDMAAQIFSPIISPFGLVEKTSLEAFYNHCKARGLNVESNTQDRALKISIIFPDFYLPIY